jgi:hypothetical protein
LTQVYTTSMGPYDSTPSKLRPPMLSANARDVQWCLCMCVVECE